MPKQYGKVKDPSTTTLPFWTRNLQGRIGQGKLRCHPPAPTAPEVENLATAEASPPAPEMGVKAVGSRLGGGEEEAGPRPGSHALYDGTRWEGPEFEPPGSAAPCFACPARGPSPNLARFHSLGEPRQGPSVVADPGALPFASLARVQELHASTGLDPAYYKTKNAEYGVTNSLHWPKEARPGQTRPRTAGSDRPQGYTGLGVDGPAGVAVHTRMRLPRRAW